MKASQLTADKLIGLFFLLCGVVYLLSCKGLTLGTFSSPGEGFVPLIIGSLLVLCSIIFLCRKTKTVQAKEPLSREAVVRIIKITIATLAYVLFISLIGFKLSTLLVLIVMIRIFGNTNWKSNLIFSVITTVFTILLFQVWLQLPLPEPLLDLILGS